MSKDEEGTLACAQDKNNASRGRKTPPKTKKKFMEI
jgi:hypothetical protein